MPGAEERPACPDDGWVMAARWSHHRGKRHIRADELSPVLTGQVRARLEPLIPAQAGAARP
jgi:hypothetical protein